MWIYPTDLLWWAQTGQMPGQFPLQSDVHGGDRFDYLQKFAASRPHIRLLPWRGRHPLADLLRSLANVILDYL